MLALSAFFAAIACPSVHAEKADDPRRPEMIVPRYVDAVVSRDSERRLAIVHSLSRACMNPETQPYFDWIFSGQARLVSAGERRVTSTPIDKTPTVLPTDGRSDYLVRPTHQVQIDFVTGPYRSASVVLFVAWEGAQWREVLPCPRGDVQARARAKQLADRQHSAKTRELADAMPASLRSELVALLQAGRKVEAIRRYAAAAGQDISISKSVVESLEGRVVPR